MSNTANTFHAWDASTDTLLRTCYIQGEALVEIAEAQQRTVAEVKARIIQLRILPNFYAATPTVLARDTYKKIDNERTALEPVRVVNMQSEAPPPVLVKQAMPGNAGKKWDAEQERMLAESFAAGMGVAALAQLYERTEDAIASRLFRLGLIADPFVSSNGKKIELTAVPVLACPPEIIDSEFPF